MIRHVMVDIETMSPHPWNALVLSIGAVHFIPDRPDAPYIDVGMSVALDPLEQMLWGREVDPATQKWWAERDVDAQDCWLRGKHVDVLTGLNLLSTYLYGTTPSEDVLYVWAHGVGFDFGNLESLYRKVFGPHSMPWKYNAVRDSRTIAREFPKQRTTSRTIAGVAHDPVADCITQIWDLWERWPQPAR